MEGMPQGRPEVKGLGLPAFGYLKAKGNSRSLRDDNKKGKVNGNGNRGVGWGR